MEPSAQLISLFICTATRLPDTGCAQLFDFDAI
jgi:hypothetical protein